MSKTPVRSEQMLKSSLPCRGLRGKLKDTLDHLVILRLLGKVIIKQTGEDFFVLKKKDVFNEEYGKIVFRVCRSFGWSCAGTGIVTDA